MRYTTKEAKSILKDHENHFGIQIDKDNLSQLEDMISLYKDIKAGRTIPDRSPDQSEDEYIEFILKTKGMISAVQIIGQIKGMHLKEAKEYADELKFKLKASNG